MEIKTQVVSRTCSMCFTPQCQSKRDDPSAACLQCFYLTVLKHFFMIKICTLEELFNRVVNYVKLSE